MQRDGNYVFFADAARKLVRDEDVPLSASAHVDICTDGVKEQQQTHKFALRIKIHRSDFLPSSQVRIWAEGVPVYARWRGAKVMRDGGYGYDAHDTRGRVLSTGDQSGEQQLRKIEVTYERAV
jgi:hypothetical protein